MVPTVLSQFCPDPGFSIAFFSPLRPQNRSWSRPPIPRNSRALPGYCRGQVWERKIVKIFLAKQGDLKFGQSLVLQIDQTGVFKIWAESCA